MSKSFKIKSLAICVILLAGIIFPTALTAQRSDMFFKADNEDIYSNRANISDTGNLTLGGFQNEDPTPVGSGLLILTIAGAGYAMLRRKHAFRNGSTFLLAMIMLLGLTQCKKKVITPSNPNNNKVYITLNASYGGNRTVFDPTVSDPNNAFTWTPNVPEYVYVGGSFHAGLMGTLSGITSTSDEHTISFSGTIYDVYDNEKLYFFYLGKGTRRYDYPTQVVCIADQTGNLSDVTDFHIAIGSATHHRIEGQTAYSYNANLEMAMAIAYFDLSDFGNEEVRIYGDDLYTIAEVDYQHGQLVGKAKGSIKTKSVSGGNYIALIPSTKSYTEVKFVSDHYKGMMNFNRGIKAKRYYSSNGSPLNVQDFDSYTIGQDGLLSGEFTVSSSGNKVHFSQGNLQYKGSAAKPYWKFADNQWDSIVGQDCDDENVDRDLFGWATSGYHRNIDSVNCRNFPFTTTTASAVYRGHGNNNYPGYGPTRFKTGDGGSGAFPNNSIEIKPLDLVQESADYDWGIHNAISNGGNMPNKWRLLTNAEWGYILNTRQTSITIESKPARYTLATIVFGENSKVRGLILFPDTDVTGEINSIEGITWGTINGNSLFTTVCTEEAWNELQDAGCVFLRAAGYRSNTTMMYEGMAGYYWSSVSSGPNIARSVFLGYLGTGNPGVNYNLSQMRYYGCAVRLVRDVN